MAPQRVGGRVKRQSLGDCVGTDSSLEFTQRCGEAAEVLGAGLRVDVGVGGRARRPPHLGGVPAGEHVVDPVAVEDCEEGRGVEVAPGLPNGWSCCSPTRRGDGEGIVAGPLGRPVGFGKVGGASGEDVVVVVVVRCELDAGLQVGASEDAAQQRPGGLTGAGLDRGDHGLGDAGAGREIAVRVRGWLS